MHLSFDRGTVLLRAPRGPRAPPGMAWDDRVGAWRAPAFRYPGILASLRDVGHQPSGSVLAAGHGPPRVAPPELRPYQHAALCAWQAADHRGVVALPTGSGKTRVALAAIAGEGHRALCLVPTLALLSQWVRAVERAGLGPVGVQGGGRDEVGPVTAATFASARRRMDLVGDRFELVVVDEAHHVGACDEALQMCAAPRRLGLTATPPDAPGAARRLAELVGPVVVRVHHDELAGRYLAPYDLHTVEVDLTPAERAAYEGERLVCRPFFRMFRQSFPGAGWRELVRAAQASEPGREALVAWRRSRALVAYPRAKQATLRSLLEAHRADRVLVFTADNATAYRIASEHLVMPITCDSGPRERRLALERFAAGELRVLVSAQVLNEGVDVPEAAVAVIVGGSGGRRERLQRIGRVLRPAPGKRAVVYQLVVRGTHEQPPRRRRAL